MPRKPREAAICDANVLIDYVESDEDIIREIVAYWGTVHVPDRVLVEVRRLSAARAVELGLTIIETPLALPTAPGLSGPDRACLHYVVAEGWTCIANDTALRRECRHRGGKVVWGLQMLLLLVSSGRITKARAADVAVRIGTTNPEITPKVVEDFNAKLARMGHG